MEPEQGSQPRHAPDRCLGLSPGGHPGDDPGSRCGRRYSSRGLCVQSPERRGPGPVMPFVGPRRGRCRPLLVAPSSRAGPADDPGGYRLRGTRGRARFVGAGTGRAGAQARTGRGHRPGRASPGPARALSAGGAGAGARHRRTLDSDRDSRQRRHSAARRRAHAARPDRDPGTRPPECRHHYSGWPGSSL